MNNRLEDQDSTYSALANSEGQYSLWSEAMKVPAGWDKVHGPASRQACLDYIETHWLDMRPKSLINAMNESKHQNLAA